MKNKIIRFHNWRINAVAAMYAELEPQYYGCHAEPGITIAGGG